MAKATVSELDKRLSAHEAACDQRWKENYRRLGSIEAAEYWDNLKGYF